MERTADPDRSDVALADLPPAPWTAAPGSDAEVIYRRPPAERSFPAAPDDAGLPDPGGRHGAAEPPAGRYQDRQAEAWEAFAPAGTGAEAWEAFAPSTPAGHGAEAGWETSGEISPPLPEQPGGWFPRFPPGTAEPDQPGPHDGHRPADDRGLAEGRGLADDRGLAEGRGLADGRGPAEGRGPAHVAGSVMPRTTTAAPGPWPHPGPVEDPAPPRASFGVTGGPISPSGLADLPRPIDSAPVRRRSRVASALVTVMALVVVLGAAAGGVAYFSESGRAWLTGLLNGDTPAAAPAPAAVPVGGRTTATFVLSTAAPAVTVRAADLGADLFRVAGAAAPAVTGDRVELRTGGDADRVEVQLSTRVAWSVQLTGGSRSQVVDLTGGRVGSIALAGASDRTELVLPRPSGTVPLTVTGAVADLTVTAPAAHPVRVALDSGAVTVTAGSRTLKDVAPGSTLTPRNWKTKDRYDLDAASRLTALKIRSVG